jgi:hypothetical protein
VIEQTDCTGFVAMSNHEAAMNIEDGDQRYFAIASWFPPAEGSFYDEYYDWLGKVNSSSLAPNYLLHYLLNDVDMTGFSLATAPYITETAAELTALGRPDYEQSLGDDFAERSGVFQLEVFTLKRAVDHLKSAGNKMGRNGVSTALKHLGYTKYRGSKKMKNALHNTPEFFTLDNLAGWSARELFEYYEEKEGKQNKPITRV